MPSAYPQRALTVLLLFGTLSAAMALLSSSLIFQLPSGRAAAGTGALPEPVAAALLPVSAVLAALCLVLNVSCLLLCLLHGYCSTELCRGQPGSERADWFLLDSRSVRHAAIGLFCCGVCLYLTGTCPTSIPRIPEFPPFPEFLNSVFPAVPQGVPEFPNPSLFPDSS
ncbi:transmembrane protein 221-like [Parus major]|uniref:transmembrane protein 221-like n=1 Tax=Parus major TaxID=9157 RepID=UPI0014449401|nr:transmembrane protein 221-like [Parus major]